MVLRYLRSTRPLAAIVAGAIISASVGCSSTPERRPVQNPPIQGANQAASPPAPVISPAIANLDQNAVRYSPNAGQMNLTPSAAQNSPVFGNPGTQNLATQGTPGMQFTPNNPAVFGGAPPRAVSPPAAPQPAIGIVAPPINGPALHLPQNEPGQGLTNLQVPPQTPQSLPLINMPDTLTGGAQLSGATPHLTSGMAASNGMNVQTPTEPAQNTSRSDVSGTNTFPNPNLGSAAPVVTGSPNQNIQAQPYQAQPYQATPIEHTNAAQAPQNFLPPATALPPSTMNDVRVPSLPVAQPNASSAGELPKYPEMPQQSKVMISGTPMVPEIPQALPSAHATSPMPAAAQEITLVPPAAQRTPQTQLPQTPQPQDSGLNVLATFGNDPAGTSLRVRKVQEAGSARAAEVSPAPSQIVAPAVPPPADTKPIGAPPSQTDGVIPAPVLIVPPTTLGSR